GGIESHVGGTLERGALLDKVIRDELECAALRKDRRFLMDRAVFESEEKVRGYATAMGHLSQVTGGKALAIQCAQHEKAVKKPLRQPYRHCFRQQWFRDSAAENEDSDKKSDTDA
ncbi:MAG TPA: hypothetical protein VFO27_19720, partial [Bryobacteraceae bacterium]|nr:hypothetical protein [Bryobacteraceae bacterium]